MMSFFYPCLLALAFLFTCLLLAGQALTLWDHSLEIVQRERAQLKRARLCAHLLAGKKNIVSAQQYLLRLSRLDKELKVSGIEQASTRVIISLEKREKELRCRDLENSHFYAHAYRADNPHLHPLWPNWSIGYRWRQGG